MTQKVAMVFGASFLLFAALGVSLPGEMGMEADPGPAPDLLGLFPVNLVHLAFGVWGWRPAPSRPRRRSAARVARSTSC